MPESSPWDEIGVPAADYNVRQVAGATPVPCFWGRDTAGCNLFILKLAGDHMAQFRRNVPAMNGVGVDLRDGGSGGTQRFVLTLEQQVDRDLFEGLCLTLVSALSVATDSSSSLAVSLAHIRRWKTFLAGRGGQHLSPEEIRGLFAELTFLLELLDRFPTSAHAVAAWLGPEKSQQDFIYGNTAVEIKSVSGAERSTVRISSENQLESLNDALFARVYRLSNLPEAAQAISLNGIVARVQGRLSHAEAVDSFDRKLIAHGYAPLPQYDEPALVVTDVRSYRVTDAFPRLIRSTLPGGIMNVTYDIKLEAIAPFQCDNNDIFRGS